MTHFHAVMLDETRCEFGVGVNAPNREAAYEYLRENYPESQCVQLESPEDTRQREDAMYERLYRQMDEDLVDDYEEDYY